jgi:hypothetical protein
MRTGLFLAVFGAILAVVSFLTPLPGDFSSIPGGPVPLPTSPPRCLALLYDSRDPWDPTGIRVRPDRYVPRTTAVWYRADFVDRPPHWRDAIPRIRLAIWQPAGPDSLDIVTPVQEQHIRLPVRGDTLVGRAGWAGYSNWVDALTSRRYVVRAIDVKCDSLSPAWPSN